jgi:hypothetical protein
MARRKKPGKKWWILVAFFITALVLILGYDWWKSRKVPFCSLSRFWYFHPRELSNTWYRRFQVSTKHFMGISKGNESKERTAWLRVYKSDRKEL